jgi:hypothetical protein
MWVDFYGHDHETMPTVAQWDFIARNYAIVSLEKCFAHRAFPWTNDAVHAGAAALKAINPDVKVLFYQNSLINFMSCYEDGAEFAHRPDWWLKDDSGNPYKLHGDNHTRMYDLRLEAVRDFVARASVAVANASTLLDGIFGDKASDIHMADMSDARWHELMAWHHVSLNHTRQAVQAAMAPGALVLANGVRPTPPSRMEPQDEGLENLPFVDGMCLEHFLGFEMLDEHTGVLDPARFRLAHELIHNATAQGKYTLVRGWPGPVQGPIGPLGPSWSAASGLTTPTTRHGRATAAAQFAESTVAAYLIVASEYTFLSYNWWYGVSDGVYPCPEDPSSCSAPASWYPLFAKAPGPPLGPAVERRSVWTRDFRNATVVFDASNITASTITWH